jgi:hypothetical protein
MMTITITMDDNGQISSECCKDGVGPVLGHDVILALGMMETAKNAMLAGRWGVMDSEKKSARGFKPVSYVEKKKPRRPAAKSE